MTGTLVQVQTLRGTAGIAEALKAVEAAVGKYNTEHAKAEKHVCVKLEALPNNVKGMQWQLALLATLARRHGATMIRLSVHNGQVALCGPAKAVEATRKAMEPAYNELVTLVANAYKPAEHGNRVGFTNGWLCGAPAGMADAVGIKAELAYGIGFLFSFPKPGDGKAYDAGYAAIRTLTSGKPMAGLDAPKRTRKPRGTATKTPKAAEGAENANGEQVAA